MRFASGRCIDPVLKATGKVLVRLPPGSVLMLPMAQTLPAYYIDIKLQLQTAAGRLIYVFLRQSGRFASMIDDIYNKRILEFAGNMERLGRLPEPDAVAKVHSKLCGSTVTVYLKMVDGRVTDFAHEVKACALGQASSSVMARNIIGATAEELKAVRDEMYTMLKEEGPAPEGRFADLKYFEPVREYKARHASTLLTFDAVVDCIRQIEEKAKAA